MEINYSADQYVVEVIWESGPWQTTTRQKGQVDKRSETRVQM